MAEKIDVKFIEIAKGLAHNDTKVRRKTMMEDLRQLITTFHFTHSESSYHDSVNMMKLWKGLFYCYWMTDKPVVQEYVAKEMANFTLLFNDNSLSLLYLQCFWRILMREWVGIDYLRLNKYYMLVKAMIAVSFEWLKEEEWDAQCIEAYNEFVVLEEVLNESGLKIAPALCYYYCEKLLESFTAKDTEHSSETLKTFIIPIIEVYRKSYKWTVGGKVLRAKIDEFVFGPLLQEQVAEEYKDYDLSHVKQLILRLKRK